MRVLLNGKLAFEDSVGISQPELPFGTHVFNLTGPSDDPAKMRWMAVGLEKQVDKSGKSLVAEESALLVAFTIHRVNIPDNAAHRLAGLLHPAQR
jgi:hypothetical protein